jgi:hypothetical protein
MIIKDKPFRIPSCQAMACRCYYPAVVIRREIAIPESIFCTHDLVRRLPGFLKLEAYQVRLSRLLVLRRLGRVRGCRHWDDGLFHAGGAL